MIHSSIWLLVALVPGQADALKPVGRISDRSIRETSGIVKSRKHPDVFWTISDSGNPPMLHAIRTDGRVIHSFRVALPNVDWEDVAIDDDAHIYIAETGNNGHLLPLRAIYRVDEPDPGRPGLGDLPVKVASFYWFASPAERFDAEALFIRGKEAFVIEKRLDGRPPGVFSIPIDPPAPLSRPAIPKRVGELADFTTPVTGADLTADGKRLAVVSNSEVRIYDRASDGRLTLHAKLRYKSKDVEAIAWDGPDLILSTEAGALFRIAAATRIE